jgi:hypothetical protein
MRHGLSKTAWHGLSKTRNTAYRKPRRLINIWQGTEKGLPSNGANKESFGFLLTRRHLTPDASPARHHLSGPAS